jgi:hypothetical protein
LEKDNRLLKGLKKVFHILKYILLSLVILFVLLIGAINLPFAQRFLTNKVNSVFHEKGLPVHVGKITLLVTGKIGLSHLEFITEARDTIVYSGDISISVRPIALFQRHLVIQNVNCRDVVVNLLTDKKTGKLAFLSLFPTSSKPSPQEKNASKPWDIIVNEVHLRNIRFFYDDSIHGIVIRQALYKADLIFDDFSTLRKRIDIASVKIQKVNGSVAILKVDKDTVQTVSGPSPWKFSARSLQIKDILFTLDQPDSKQRIDVSLRQGDFSVKTLDLAHKEFAISQLNLVDPSVVFNSSEVASSSIKTANAKAISLPRIPWSIECILLSIKNGTFLVNNANAGKDKNLQQWMPVQAFNTTIKNLKTGPGGSRINISDLSFDLNHQALLESGEIILEADSLWKGNLSIELAAVLDFKKQSRLARNEVMRCSAVFSGSMDILQIEKLNLHTPTGNDFSISGYLTNLMKMPKSGCELKFSTRAITRDQTKELIALFGPSLNLPDFRPVILAGSIRNSLFAPEFNMTVKSESGNVGLAGNLDLKKKTGKLEAFLSQVKLGELLGNPDLDRITGRVNLDGNWNNLKNLAGEGTIKIDSISYKDVTTSNILANLSVINNQCLFTISAADTGLVCALNGLFAWNNGFYHGQLSGDFNMDAGRLQLFPGQIGAESEITAAFNKTPDSLWSSVDLKNLTIRNGINKSNLQNTSLVLNMADSLFHTKLETDFLSAGFDCQASLADILIAIDSSKVKSMFSFESARFLNLDAISRFPGFKLNASAKYDSLFGLFLPDTVFNFNSIKLSADKESNSSQAKAEILTDGLIYKPFKSFGASVQAKLQEDKLSCKIYLDSLNVDKVPLGASSLDLNVLSESMLGNLLVSDRKGLPLYKLGAEVQKKNDQIILRSPDPDWILNSSTWTLSPAEFLNWESSSRDLVANVHLQHDDMKIDLSGRKSENLNLDLQNVLLSMLVSPELFKQMPDGTLNANVTYNDNYRQNLDFKFDITQMKWEGVLVDKLAAKGRLVADSSGILESELAAIVNDSSTLNISYGSKNIHPGQLFHSSFSNFSVPLIEPLINKYANRLQGSASGEISLTKENNKNSLNGEIRMKGMALNIVPLNAWFSIPEDTIVVKQNQLYLNQFTILDSLQKRSYVNGKIDLNDPDNMTADLHVALDKLQVMNTTIKDNPVFFGSIVVNSGLDITGSLQSPTIKGNVALESGTNITYRQIQDISVKEKQQAITFAKLDGNHMIKNEGASKLNRLSRMPTIQTSIEINPKSIFNIEISSVYDVAIHISGGGLLDYSVMPNNTASITGSYEIQNGTSELKFTGWPKKNFTITPGSMLRWNGSIDDPELYLEATSKVKGSYVNPVDNKSRSVDFIVSMKLANQLSQLTIVFDVNSPDQYITSVLNTLSPDEVMRQAVNLLLFESIELPGIESSSTYMGSQLSSFVESQLNSMTKSNLKSVDLSLGVDTYKTSSSSAEKTSFTYEMERKLWKDRASVKLSGRLNDDTHAEQTNAVIENFTFEYAVDTVGTKFLKLYRHQDYEDILTGEVIKSGVGFIYRKSYPNLHDIWKRKDKKKSKSVEQSPDNTK